MVTFFHRDTGVRKLHAFRAVHFLSSLSSYFRQPQPTPVLLLDSRPSKQFEKGLRAESPVQGYQDFGLQMTGRISNSSFHAASLEFANDIATMTPG